MRTTPELLALAQAIVNDLDLPKKTFRLTYTVTDVDGNKPGAPERFSMVMISGQNSKLKQGSKVPIATGSYNAVATTGDHPSAAGAQTQFTYVDVGMIFDATLVAESSGATLKSVVERTSVAPEVSGVGPQDPILRQSSLSGSLRPHPGKARHHRFDGNCRHHPITSTSKPKYSRFPDLHRNSSHIIHRRTRYPCSQNLCHRRYRLTR